MAHFAPNSSPTDHGSPRHSPSRFLQNAAIYSLDDDHTEYEKRRLYEQRLRVEVPTELDTKISELRPEFAGLKDFVRETTPPKTMRERQRTHLERERHANPDRLPYWVAHSGVPSRKVLKHLRVRREQIDGIVKEAENFAPSESEIVRQLEELGVSQESSSTAKSAKVEKLIGEVDYEKQREVVEAERLKRLAWRAHEPYVYNLEEELKLHGLNIIEKLKKKLDGPEEEKKDDKLGKNTFFQRNRAVDPPLYFGTVKMFNFEKKFGFLEIVQCGYRPREISLTDDTQDDPDMYIGTDAYVNIAKIEGGVSLFPGDTVSFHMEPSDSNRSNVSYEVRKSDSKMFAERCQKLKYAVSAKSAPKQKPGSSQTLKLDWDAKVEKKPERPAKQPVSDRPARSAGRSGFDRSTRGPDRSARGFDRSTRGFDRPASGVDRPASGFGWPAGGASGRSVNDFDWLPGNVEQGPEKRQQPAMQSLSNTLYPPADEWGAAQPGAKKANSVSDDFWDTWDTDTVGDAWAQNHWESNFDDTDDLFSDPNKPAYPK